MAFKEISWTAAALALIATSAAAQPAPAVQPAPAAHTGNVCLKTYQIQRTAVPDTSTILFYMKDGKVWKNTLKGPCPGLTFNGFAYTATPPNQICGNLQTIRAVQTGSVCMLGAFTPYDAKAKPPGSGAEAPPPDTAGD